MRIKYFFHSKIIFLISTLLLSNAPAMSANVIYNTPSTYPSVHYEQLNFILIKAPISCSAPYPIVLHVIKNNHNSSDIVEIDSGSQGNYKKISMTQDNNSTSYQEKFEYRLTNNSNTLLTLNGMRLIDAKTYVEMSAGTWVDNKGCQGTFYSTPVLSHLD